MPQKTPNYKLNIYDESDGNEYFLDYRLAIDGTSSDSNFVIIDGVLADLDKRINEISVSVPIATNNATGVVKGSLANDRISIDSDGTMIVNKLNIMKLYSSSSDELILDGGNSKLRG